MKSRCINPSLKQYPDYGGRGIAVHPRWLSFIEFLADMGECPPGMELDRIDVNGNYEPGNVRWASESTQQNNRRDNIVITIDGIAQTLSQWARQNGIKPRTANERVRRGWDPRKAVTEAIK
jgi:hypothetical protein